MRLLLIALALSLAGSAADQARPAKPAAPHVRTGRAQPGPSDAQIEAAIRARFAKSKISKNGFRVKVQGGIATLEGQTDVIQHKGTATRIAKSAGAAQVVNKIQVSQAARERAAANLAKGRRRAQVKRSEPRSRP